MSDCTAEGAKDPLYSAGRKEIYSSGEYLDGDWTYVTRNSVDFRGLAEDPGTQDQHADVALHAGLVCINGPATMSAGLNSKMFEALLLELDEPTEMVNEVVEVTLDEAEEELRSNATLYLLSRSSRSSGRT